MARLDPALWSHLPQPPWPNVSGDVVLSTEPRVLNALLRHCPYPSVRQSLFEAAHGLPSPIEVGGLTYHPPPPPLFNVHCSPALLRTSLLSPTMQLCELTRDHPKT